MGRFRLDGRVTRQGFGRLGDHLSIGDDETGGDGGLGGGTAAEMAEGNKHPVGTVGLRKISV
jgi:hypothetical protein